MNEILIAAGVLAALGLVSGGILAIVGRIFSVEVDRRQAEILGALPGANCGVCGFAGCEDYAAAIVAGSAPVDRCPAGGDEAAGKLALIMGAEMEPREKLVAAVMCGGDTRACRSKAVYHGPKDCRSAALVAGGEKACKSACLGYGDCQAACPFGAIRLTGNGLAYVIDDLCTGCGVCVASCPKGVIRLLPKRHMVRGRCSSAARGKAVSEDCSAGCIGCGKCEKSCEYGALVMENGLPAIDHAKCTGCLRCAKNCPIHALSINSEMDRRAVVEKDRCAACGECKKVCPRIARRDPDQPADAGSQSSDASELPSQGREPYRTRGAYGVEPRTYARSWERRSARPGRGANEEEPCSGCGACLEACPVKCIRMEYFPKVHRRRGYDSFDIEDDIEELIRGRRPNIPPYLAADSRSRSSCDRQLKNTHPSELV